MSLIVGNDYYYLTAAQYDELTNLYSGDDGLIDDFILAPDGYYYAPVDSISDDELDFLFENGWGDVTAYSTSTQPGGGM